MLRIIMGGIVGGILVFIGGFVSHMGLGLAGRHVKSFEQETEFRTDFARHAKVPGIYAFPGMPKNLEKLDKAAQDAANAKLAEEYKKGPAAFIIIAPTGQEMMSSKTLMMELLSNIGAAVIVASLVSMAAPNTGFFSRFLMVVMMGLFTWLSSSASDAIWYKFPVPFVVDELYCDLIEWSFGALGIASIVRPITR